jgi:hypothetical protein
MVQISIVIETKAPDTNTSRDDTMATCPTKLLTLALELELELELELALSHSFAISRKKSVSSGSGMQHE